MYKKVRIIIQFKQEFILTPRTIYEKINLLLLDRTIKNERMILRPLYHRERNHRESRHYRGQSQ